MRLLPPWSQQVGSVYKYRELPSEELLTISEMEPPIAPSVRLHEALGFGSEFY